MIGGAWLPISIGVVSLVSMPPIIYGLSTASDWKNKWVPYFSGGAILAHCENDVYKVEANLKWNPKNDGKVIVEDRVWDKKLSKKVELSDDGISFSVEQQKVKFETKTGEKVMMSVGSECPIFRFKKKSRGAGGDWTGTFNYSWEIGDYKSRGTWGGLSVWFELKAENTDGYTTYSEIGKEGETIVMTMRPI